jgi:hypothetical protein
MDKSNHLQPHTFPVFTTEKGEELAELFFFCFPDFVPPTSPDKTAGFSSSLFRPKIQAKPSEKHQKPLDNPNIIHRSHPLLPTPIKEFLDNITTEIRLPHNQDEFASKTRQSLRNSLRRFHSLFDNNAHTFSSFHTLTFNLNPFIVQELKDKVLWDLIKTYSHLEPQFFKLADLFHSTELLVFTKIHQTGSAPSFQKYRLTLPNLLAFLTKTLSTHQTTISDLKTWAKE